MNILLYVAEISRLYYPPSETPKMLGEFIPLVTQDVSCERFDLTKAYPHVMTSQFKR